MGYYDAELKVYAAVIEEYTPGESFVLMFFPTGFGIEEAGEDLFQTAIRWNPNPYAILDDLVIDYGTIPSESIFPSKPNHAPVTIQEQWEIDSIRLFFVTMPAFEAGTRVTSFYFTYRLPFTLPTVSSVDSIPIGHEERYIGGRRAYALSDPQDSAECWSTGNFELLSPVIYTLWQGFRRVYFTPDMLRFFMPQGLEDIQLPPGDDPGYPADFTYKYHVMFNTAWSIGGSWQYYQAIDLFQGPTISPEALIPGDALGPIGLNYHYVTSTHPETYGAGGLIERWEWWVRNMAIRGLDLFNKLYLGGSTYHWKPNGMFFASHRCGNSQGGGGTGGQAVIYFPGESGGHPSIANTVGTMLLFVLSTTGFTGVKR